MAATLQNARKKLKRLETILTEMDSVLVAFSGGVDSTLLLHVAAQVPGITVRAVTVKSEIFPEFEFKEAVAFVKKIKVPFKIVRAMVLEEKKVAKNPPARCYWCKRSVFSNLKKLAKTQKLAWVADGTNADDAKYDYRPGLKASKELNIRHPLFEAGLTKAEIRLLSKKLGLPTWDKPAYACLASRIPYGTPLTAENIKRVELAEKYLHGLGYRQIRVRDHDGVARIEAPDSRIAGLADPAIRKRISRRLKQLGYAYVSLDLAGYRMGSLNEPLASKKS